MHHGLFAVGLLAAIAVEGPAAQTDRPLPDPDSFFSAAREHLASNALLQRRYMFKERRTNVKFNPFGQMGTGVIEVFQVFPSIEEGMTYRRLVERDGRAVSADEVARQDREYCERYRDWQRDITDAGKSEREARERRAAITKKKEEAQAREVMNLFDYKILRREMLGGEPAIVVAFAPKADARPSSREGRVAAAFAGQAWVHETEYEVMKLEGEAHESVAFGWGIIARLNKGAKFSTTLERVNGVWLPHETRFVGGGRALLVRSVSIDYLRQFFDYKPVDPTAPPPIPGLGASEKP